MVVATVLYMVPIEAYYRSLYSARVNKAVVMVVVAGA